MAAETVQLGTGTTLTFSGVSMELLSLNWTGINRVAVDTTHLGTTGARTFVGGDVYDPGELVAEGHFVENCGTTALTATLTATATTLTVAWGGHTTYTWTAAAILTDVDVTAPLEDKITQSLTFKITDDITMVTAA